MAEPLAVEQPPHDPTDSSSRSSRSPTPVPSLDPERLVLPLEPGAADAEDRPARLTLSSVVASFAVSPGLRNVLAPTISPSRIRP